MPHDLNKLNVEELESLLSLRDAGLIGLTFDERLVITPEGYIEIQNY